MKRNNPLQTPTGYKSIFFSYKALLFYAIIEFILTWIFLYRTPHMGIDSFSYIDASKTIIIGELNDLRTPVYPLCIALLNVVFGNYWAYAMIFVQFLIFLFSGIYLLNIASKLIKNPKINYWIVFFYLLYPGFQNFSFRILTEVLAVSFLIFFVWSVIRWIDNPKSYFKIIELNIWIFLLIFLRPVFIFLLPVELILILFLLFFKYINYKTATYSFLVSCTVILSVVCYKNKITRTFGINSISSVTTVNNYFALRYAGIIDPDLTKNEDFKNYLKDLKDYKNVVINDSVWYEWLDISSRYHIAEIDEYENTAIKTYPAQFLKGLTNRWSFEASTWRAIPDIYWYPGYLFEGIIWPNMGFYLLMCILFIIGVWISWKKEKKFPIITFFLIMICVGLFLTTVFGAQSEYSRLNLPGVPLFLLLIGEYISMFKIDRSNLLT